MKAKFAWALLALAGTPVHSEVLFSGGMDAATFSTKYQVSSYGYPFAASASDGVISIRKLTTPGIGVVGVTYAIPKIEVLGNFRQDVTIDVNDVIDPYPDRTIFAGLSVNFGGVENSAQFNALTDSAGRQKLGFSFLSDNVSLPYSELSFRQTTAHIRVERRGDTVSTFIRSMGGSYNFLGSVSGEDFLRPATFYLSLNAYRPTVFGATARFSDFSIATVPEPATWTMMIIGFGLVGWVARRRHAYRAVANSSRQAGSF